MRRQIKDRGGGGGVRRGIEGVVVCDERHGSEANEGFARAGAGRRAHGRGGLSAGAVSQSLPSNPHITAIRNSWIKILICHSRGATDLVD